MLKIYHNPRCSKSRQTLQLIEESAQAVEVVEYLKTPLTKEELQKITEKLGIKPEALVRKGEDIYKDKYKGREMSDNDWFEAMAENPKLIERPIVVKDKQAVLGRPPENVKVLL